MCIALSDPPNEFAPSRKLELVVMAMQLEHGALLMLTSVMAAIVAAHLLLLLALKLELHAYAPMCIALSDPPNEFVP